MKRKFIAMILIICMIFVGIAGCSPNAEKNPADGEKTLKLRLTSSLTTLDWTATNTHDMKVCHQIFEGLYGMDEANNGYYNELAKEVTLNEDETVYTIKLVDAKFQNGDKLKASDVVFSYERAMANPAFNYLTSMIDSVEAASEDTVQINLKYPYSPIAHTFFCIKITSEKEVTEQGDKFGTIPHKAATGPYYAEEYNIASGVKLRAFEDYWRGAPNIKAVEYRVLSDDSAAVIAFENGELDYFEDASIADWDSLTKIAGENNAMIKGNNILWFGINYQANDILGNDNLRKAIFYAVNKEDINLIVNNGLGAVATEYMPSEYVATSPSSGFETYDYSVEKAKEYLADAGYPNGVSIGTILTTTSSRSVKAAQVIQDSLSKVGIKAEVASMDVSMVVEKWHAQDFDMCIFSDSGNYDYNNIRQQVHSESVGMYCIKYEGGKFDWKRIEELIDLGVSVSDVNQRLEYYTELWSIVMDSATILPCIHWPTGIVWDDNLEIGKPVPTYYKVRTFSWK